MCSTNPDYALLVISAEQGVTPVTENHFRLAFGSNVPVIVILTKVDLVNKTRLAVVNAQIADCLNQPWANKTRSLIETNEDVSKCASEMNTNVVPIFNFSSVTLEKKDLFLQFLHLLPINNSNKLQYEANAEFIVKEQFIVEKELILYGILRAG